MNWSLPWRRSHAPPPTPTAGSIYYKTVAYVIRSSVGRVEVVLVLGGAVLTLLISLSESGVSIMTIITALVMAVTLSALLSLGFLLIQALLTNVGSTKRFQTCKTELSTFQSPLDEATLRAIAEMAATDMTGIGINTALPNALWAAAFAVLAVSISQPASQMNGWLIGVLALLTLAVLINYSTNALRSQAIVTVQHVVAELLLDLSRNPQP